YFVVNKKMPIYQELRSMVLKTEGVSEILRENLSKLGEVEAAFIYGSFASGEEHSKSDIDLIIVGEVNERKLIPLIRKLEGQLSREINYTLFSSSEFKSRMRKKDPFITNVLEGKKIHILGEPSEI
ncbi:MAG: nucleotidyltransferase domain-containing protein, partial [Candidatus Hadarchaeales archaeon]